MTIDYKKLQNLDYTAHEHSQDFQEKLEKYSINHPSIRVEKDYDRDIPEVIVMAKDQFREAAYVDAYQLENVTEEEFEEVTFDVWKNAMKELEL